MRRDSAEPLLGAERPFAWVLRRVRLHSHHYLTGALAAAGTSAAAMADPFMLQSLTDHAIAQRSGSLLLAGAAGLFAASALRQGLNAVSTFASFRAAPGFSLRLRRDTLRHAGRLGADYHARVTPGHNQFLVGLDGERLTDSLHRGMSQVIALIPSIGFAALAVFHFEWRLLLAAVPLNLALLALKHRYGPELNEAAAAEGGAAFRGEGGSSDGKRPVLADRDCGAAPGFRRDDSRGVPGSLSLHGTATRSGAAMV